MLLRLLTVFSGDRVDGSLKNATPNGLRRKDNLVRVGKDNLVV
jgi:hypothetical protein